MLKNILDKYIYSDELPLEVRMNNIVYLTGLVSSLVLMLTHIITGTNVYLIIVILVIDAAIIGMLYLTNHLGLFVLCRWITMAVLCFILFPIAFFALGGQESHMPAYFVLSMVIIFLFSSGKTRVLLIVLHVAEAIACYYLSTRPFFERFVVPVNEANRLLEAVRTFTAIGFCLGVIVSFQKSLYSVENQKAYRARNDLAYRGKLLRMVNRAAELLLYAESEHPEENFRDAMEVMARSIEADRIYVWQNRIINGKLSYVQEFEWIRGGMENALKAKTGYTYCESIPPWEEKFARGDIVNGPLRSLSAEEQRVLSAFGIKAILVIPVFLQETFWGFVSFDNCRKEQTYSEETVAMLRSGCFLIANAAVRKNNELMLGIRLKQQELMAGISRSFISRRSMADLIEEALKRMGCFMGVTRILVVVADTELDESHPVYVWSCAEHWKPKKTESGFSRLITGTFPQTMPDGAAAPTFLCSDILADAEGKYAPLAKVDLKSFIWAPIYVEGVYWGMISVEECEHHRSWSESDAQLVGMVGSAIAGAVARDLMEKERSAALEQALQASMAKGNFLSNMSHEMRTPMNAIIGMTAIGKGAKDTEKKDYAFAKIEDASNHLLGVINDILDMSKIEANKLELNPVRFNFERMLHNVVNVINFRVEERRQSFYVTIDKQIPRMLLGDDQRLAQVITNLLSNAVKFTPEEGTIRLNARLAGMDDDACTIQVEVADTGIGINEEQQKRLFHSFEQAESSTTRKYGGTGLGLAISKQIVEMMGGKIWIESELGKGASFIFTANIKKDTEEHKALLDPEVNWGNVRILAVDDDAEIRNYFTDIAGRFGIRCDTAASAEEAIGLVEGRGNYDIYFIDWKMPGINGLELAGKIKARGAKSVVTMISAAVFNDIEDEAKTAGVEKFLSKPIFPSDIADWINTCLGMPDMAIQAEAEGPDTFSENRVLLVEDVDINREIVIALLEPTGLVIDCAENGLEAVEKFRENPGTYDMIFMDVQMPEMDGYEATRKIRELEKEMPNKPDRRNGQDGIPIVAMTANVFREDIERSLAAGMNDHLGKPLDFNDVLVKLRKYLPGRQADTSKLIKYGESGDDSENWKYGIAWSPELVTGNSQIDSQHKQIFRLTSNLSAACMNGRGPVVLGETLEFLASYTIRHFADEEQLQLDCRYPAYEEHKRLHDEFKNTVAGLVEEYKQAGSSGELLEKVNSVIVRWLVEHIKKEDLKLAAFIKTQG